MKENEQEGAVIENLPNALHRVELADGRQIICHLSGKMKINHISVMVGDKVLLLVDPYGGKTTNRITRRL